MNVSSGILVHYYLNGEEHLIDAQLRNKCEAELIALYQEVARIFDVDFHVLAMPPHEGGFKEFWQFLDAHNRPITSLSAIAAVLGIFLTHVPTENDRLTEQLTRLQIEEKQLQIKKIKKEFHEIDEDHSPALIDQAAKVLRGNNKTITRRSNFYKNLSTNHDVRELGIGTVAPDGRLTADEVSIARKDFPRFVLKTNKLPPILDEKAIVEIIAPVLDEGPYKWRGLYQGSPITFSMTDDIFRASVMAETVSFKHGTTIQCVIEIHRKLDETGEEVVTGHSVPVVLGIGDENNIEETSQGNDYKQMRKEQKAQGDMFNAYEN